MTDEAYMREAIALARKGAGYVTPNPLVGAVIVKDGEIIGRGYHTQYGKPHAEREALADCEISPEGVTIYVTLEPCCHQGKQPPCTDALIDSGIARVVVGTLDVNPIVRGKGIQILRDHGIEVTTGVLEDECYHVNRIFMKYMRTKQPYVMMKYAMTMDGKIATVTGDSKWITGEVARDHTHHERHDYHAIMVGVNTVVKDNPSLTCHFEGGIDPVRIIVDTHLRTPIDATVVTTAEETPTIIATVETDSAQHAPYEKQGCQVLVLPADAGGHVDVTALMTSLGEQGIDSVIVEGGGTVNWSVLQAGLVDEVHTYIGPKLFGGRDGLPPVAGTGFDKVRDAVTLKSFNIKQLGSDYLIESEVISRCSQD